MGSFAYYGFLLLFGLWAVIPMWVDLIGYGPLSYVAVPPSSLW